MQGPSGRDYSFGDFERATLGFLRLGLGLPVISACGFGGVLSIRRSVSSSCDSRGAFGMAIKRPQKGKPLVYSTPASNTPEGRGRERAYFEALGRFAHIFARTETVVALALWHFARTPHDIARAVFSGVRVKEATASMRRIADVQSMAADRRQELDDIISQLTSINTARNDILHFGAVDVAEGAGTVTNALKALTDDKIQEFPISPEILAAMTADLRKIMIHFRVNFSGIPSLKAVANQLLIQQSLHAPWQYKHQPQRTAQKEAAAKSQKPRKRAPKQTHPP